jgi:hypothetical protein
MARLCSTATGVFTACSTPRLGPLKYGDNKTPDNVLWLRRGWLFVACSRPSLDLFSCVVVFTRHLVVVTLVQYRISRRLTLTSFGSTLRLLCWVPSYWMDAAPGMTGVPVSRAPRPVGSIPSLVLPLRWPGPPVLMFLPSMEVESSDHRRTVARPVADNFACPFCDCSTPGDGPHETKPTELYPRYSRPRPKTRPRR